MKNAALAVLALLLVFASALVISDRTGAQSTSQRWEYKTVLVENMLFGPFGTIYDQENEGYKDLGSGTSLIEDGSTALTEYLNELGLNGWELLGYGHSYGEIGGHFIFKRPLQ
jgi:hypothetical protein